MRSLKRPSRATVLFLGVLMLLGLACSRAKEEHERAEAPDTRAADEAAIGALSAEWSKAMAGKDVATCVSFYAEDGSMFPDRGPIAKGKEAIHAVWETLLTTPGFAGSFETTKIVVAKSSDLAYETGTYELTTNDKKGKPLPVKGKYVVVWKRQADGNWKAVADIFNADQ